MKTLIKMFGFRWWNLFHIGCQVSEEAKISAVPDSLHSPLCSRHGCQVIRVYRSQKRIGLQCICCFPTKYLQTFSILFTFSTIFPQDMKAAKGDDEKLSMISDHINQLLNEVCFLCFSENCTRNIGSKSLKCL